VATTLDVVTDRVRSLAVGLGYVETQTPFSFDLQPVGAIDGAFRVLDSGAQRIVGGFKYSEVRIDRLTIYVGRKLAGTPTQAKRLLTRDMHSLTAAIVRDGHETSGEYAVPDDGRVHEIRAEAGAEYAVLQMTVPVDYESQL
jgi:hypothetical protein